MYRSHKALLLSVLAALLLAACSEKDDAQQEAADMSEDTARAIEEAPAVEQANQDVPAPENVGAPPADATRTESGLAYIVLEDAAEGARPTVTDTVTVDYTGWTTDGRMFDSSVVRGQPATFPLDRLIAGWQEAIPLMNVGDRYRFWIPGELAYDNSNRPGAPKGMLVFDIHLLGVAGAGDAPAQD